MPRTTSRYDGHAEWYDCWNRPRAERNASEVLDLVGPGDGLCLDLGCGSGLYFDVLAATGRTVVGLDRSAGQLRIAQGRSRQIVQGDAAALPFASGVFPTVATLWISTERAAHGMAGRRRDPRAPYLPASRMAPGSDMVGRLRPQASRNAPSPTG